MNIEGNKLSRVWQMASDPDQSFGIITAFRGEYPREKNLQRNAELRADLRQADLGMFLLDGFWVEDPGTPQETRVVEDSYFVSIPVGMKMKGGDSFESVLLHLARKYDQEAVVVKLGAGKVHLLFGDGSKQVAGEFSPNLVAQAYSRLRDGQTFVFESASTPMNFGRALALQLLERCGASTSLANQRPRK